MNEMRAIRHAGAALTLLLTLTVACGEGDGGTEPDDPLTGGVLATFSVEGETFRVWVTNPAGVDQILALRDGESEARIPNGPILRGSGAGDHNAPWSWHLDPEETEMADLTAEVCSGRPSFVEEELDAFVEDVGRYCPWAAELLEVEDLR